MMQLAIEIPAPAEVDRQVALAMGAHLAATEAATRPTLAMRALPPASPGCAVSYRATAYTRRRGGVPGHRISVTRSGTVRQVRRDGVFDVVTSNGLAFISPLAITKISPPRKD